MSSDDTKRPDCVGQNLIHEVKLEIDNQVLRKSKPTEVICEVDNQESSILYEVKYIMIFSGHREDTIWRVYAIYNPNKISLYRSDQLTQLDRFMNDYDTCVEERFFPLVIHDPVLPIMDNERKHNYLVIENNDHKFLVARCGKTMWDICENYYGYDNQKQFCNLDQLPEPFKNLVKSMSIK